MSSSLALLFAAFLILWLAAVLWVPGRHRTALTWRSAGLPLFLYSILFLAAAWWWHVPLAVPKALGALATSSPLAAPQIDCAQVPAAAAAIARASEGQLAIAADGALLVKGELWQALAADQRTALLALARQVSACSPHQSAVGPGAPLIKDMDTGASLTR